MADNENGRVLSRRLLTGAECGALATLAMSAVMLAGVATGVSPMPKPIPVALVSHTLGLSPGPALIVLAVVAHLAYGAGAGAVLAGLVDRIAVWHGVVFAAALWVVMGLVWLPYLGWGLFGTGLTPKIAGATLVLHLVYGLTLGALLARQTRRHSAEANRQEVAR
ncbi:MAG TPA: DUF6789 family protein [Pseudonocardiaceae bacterium]|nr:DUF6789 family protein [Pseudonocardiaceae bacterium]